jgi:methylmalonyl-CoA mutase N-terminal domain/subunit
MSEEKFAESGFEIKAEYTAADVEGDPAAKLGSPGEFPFTRHIYETGYRKRPWQPSLYSGFGDAADANARFRYLLEQGNGRANVAFDLPSQIGYDSDEPRSVADIGRVGVAVDSLRDFEIMFDQIPLDKVPVSMNNNSMAPVMVAMLSVVAEQQGVPLEKVTGTMSNDILHEFLARGTWRYEVEPSLRLATDVAEFVTRSMPSFYPFNLRSILLHESAASPQQELGFSFAIARAQIDRLLERGLEIDEFAPRISFFFGTGLRFFEEAAKFRAARRIWARMMRDEYGSTSERSQRLKFTSVAACGSHMAKQLPELNLVRGALGCLSAALGGAQTMLGTTLDEAYDIPTEHAQLLALRTQQVIAMETDVTSTVDPLGGSYFVESMTDEIERLTLETMRRVEESYGGVVHGVASGSMKDELEARAYEVQREIDSAERPWVGVNVYRQEDDDHELPVFEPDRELAERRAKDLATLRKDRDEDEVARTLDGLAAAAASSENVMPAMIEAVKSYATLGEIASRLEDTFGSYDQPLAKAHAPA